MIVAKSSTVEQWKELGLEYTVGIVLFFSMLKAFLIPTDLIMAKTNNPYPPPPQVD